MQKKQSCVLIVPLKQKSGVELFRGNKHLENMTIPQLRDMNKVAELVWFPSLLFRNAPMGQDKDTEGYPLRA